MEQVKTCKKCGIEKPLSEFPKNKTMKDGHLNACKVCRREQTKQWRENNLEHLKEYQKQWRENNPGYRKQYYENNIEREKEQMKQWRENNKEHKKELGKQWKKDNPDKVASQIANRKAMKLALPHTDNFDEWLEVLDEFNGKCAITGKDKHDLEHMIPLSWGWGGSLKNNIYPMDSYLNGQKSAKNPFKFMDELSGQRRVNFEKVLRRLAELNSLTYKEYHKFVNWCEKNKRTVEQVIEDNKLGLSDVELWQLRTKKSNQTSN